MRPVSDLVFALQLLTGREVSSGKRRTRHTAGAELIHHASLALSQIEIDVEPTFTVWNSAIAQMGGDSC